MYLTDEFLGLQVEAKSDNKLLAVFFESSLPEKLRPQMDLPQFQLGGKTPREVILQHGEAMVSTCRCMLLPQRGC
jgi:hypothetical protein